MASKALNQTMRERLRGKLLAKRFEAEEKALEKREHELAERAWKKLVGPKNVETINSLPDGWLDTVGSVRVATGDRGFTILALAELKPVPQKFRGNAVKESADSSLGAAVRQLVTDKEALSDKKRELRAQIDAALGQFNTTKQLHEGWPEAAEFLPADSNEKRVPMVPVERLNEALGLQSA